MVGKLVEEIREGKLSPEEAIDIVHAAQHEDEAIEQRAQVTVGGLPAWLPEDAVYDVTNILRRWQDTFYTDQALPAEVLRRSMWTLLQSMRRGSEVDMLFPGAIKDSVQYLQDMSYLIRIHKAVRLGKVKGRAFLLGKAVDEIGQDAHAGKSSAGGKGKAGHESATKQTLRALINITGVQTSDALIDEIERLTLMDDEDEPGCMKDLYASGTHPLPLRFTDIDRDEGVAHYEKKPGQQIPPHIKLDSIRKYFPSLK